MEVVSVRVDKRTRERMRRLSHVNWSEVIRRAIREKLLEEEIKGRKLDPQRLAEAVRMTDMIRRPSTGWSSTEEVREWRDQRR
ncbi:MAG: hypothetical protein ACE5Z5_06565 [Candidatus Bathyarchaeia archaeon]